MNTWYDTFQAADGTDLIGSYRSDSGASYANLTGQAAVSCVIEGDSPYSATSGSTAFAIASVALEMNDPVSVAFTYNGPVTSATGYFAVHQRSQASGASYAMRFNCHDCRGVWVYFDATGTPNYGAYFVPSVTLPTGGYVFTYCPWNMVHAAYLQRASDGYYYNPASNAFQAGKVPYVVQADFNILAAGSPGLHIDIAGGDVNAPQITSVSGGPAIMMPPDLGSDLATDRFVRLNCLSLEGGTSPITYSLQRQPGGGGSWTTLGTMTPDTPYLDGTVAAASGYSYQLVATDATGLQRTSSPLAAATTAAQSISPYTLTAPAAPYAAWSNGTIPDDTTGATSQLHSAYVWWDDLYRQYFAVGQAQAAGGVLSMSGYVSSDLINWTPGPYNPLVTNTIDGTTYAGIHRASVVQHPSDGHYYLFFGADVGDSWQTTVFRSAAPLGPYSYFSGPFEPNGFGPGESDILTDFDGTLWGYASSSNDTVSSIICQVLPACTGYTGGNNTTLEIHEGLAPFRRDRALYCGGSRETQWAWNDNVCYFLGTSAQQPIASGYSACAVYPNASLFASAAQELAATAGAGPPSFDYGYGGAIGPTVSNGVDVDAYTGGTATGVDPVASYSTQSCKVARTLTGQRIWIADRHDDTGSAASTLVWLPMSFDALGRPSIPFVASFVPEAQPADGGTATSDVLLESGSDALLEDGVTAVEQEAGPESDLLQESGDYALLEDGASFLEFEGTLAPIQPLAGFEGGFVDLFSGGFSA